MAATRTDSAAPAPARAAVNGELRPSVRVAPRGRRRPAVVLAGIALAGFGALAAMWLVASASDRTAVVLLARDVPMGVQLTVADLTTTPVSVDPAVATVPGSELEGLLGQYTTVPLTAGALLTPGQVAPDRLLAAGQTLVPLPLTADRMPAIGLSPGDVLLVVDAPPQGADVPAGTPASFEVVVVRVGEPDVNGTRVVDVATGQGPELAVRAATGRFAVAVLPVGGGD
ncbi:SAF domain-containing protein [Cellulomonas endophytica]|uniref:SAF domain-containing protein n=1 Tax=Cellulomonas endophytica TaxID=2494735 RepID=UPI00101048C5|nr:SAF domain-containing protein [Cellulomonas endophytica]